MTHVKNVHPTVKLLVYHAQTVTTFTTVIVWLNVHPITMEMMMTILVTHATILVMNVLDQLLKIVKIVFHHTSFPEPNVSNHAQMDITETLTPEFVMNVL